MERLWPDEAFDFEQAVRAALLRSGGIGLARRCEADPTLRSVELRPVLESLGLFDLDVSGSETEAAAAARALYAAGSVVCPWPLVQKLAVPAALRGEVDALYLRDAPPHRAEHLDIAGRAIALNMTTLETDALSPAGELRGMPLDPFGVPCEVSRAEVGVAPAAYGTYIVLAAFWIDGALSRACDLVIEHARERHQFGRPIASFGAIQWRLSDIAVAHDGLWELACFSLGRLIEDRLTRADALALHHASLDTARTVLRASHQIMGAMGLSDEHDLTVLNRHLQAMLRRPCGLTRVLGILTDEVGRSGFDGLYPIPPTREAADTVADQLQQSQL